MDLSLGTLVPGILFGFVGLYILRLAKKEANLLGIMLGMVLMVYPYFVYNVWALWGIGVVLSVIAIRSLGN